MEIKNLLLLYIHIAVASIQENETHAAKEVFQTSRSRLMKNQPSARPRSGSSDEKRLTKQLLQNYQKIGKEGRPVSNSSQAVYVKFGLAMMQMRLDERQNRLSVSVWCRYRWEDEFLTWDPEDHGGVKSVRLTSKKIWIPDIMLYNTADTHKLERDVLVVVSHSGSVLWIPHRIYHASCSVDVTNFPFDSQVCHMTFGSWAYHGNEIDLTFYEDLEQMDISDLEKESTEWVITAKTENRETQYYDCCDEPYVTLTFTLALKRKLVFSSFILTLPCIFLACMTLVVFWLPPERPDRTSLAMSLFASFLLLLLILVEAAPPTASSVPLLGVYYCFNMVIIMLSIFLSCVVINISRRGDAMRPLPNWLRVIAINGLSKVFCTRNRNLSRQAAPGGITSQLLRNHISRHTQGAVATATALVGSRPGSGGAPGGSGGSVKGKPGKGGSARGSGAGGAGGNRTSTIITNEGVIAIPRRNMDGGDSSPTAAIAAAIGMTTTTTSSTPTTTTSTSPRPPNTLANGGINMGLDATASLLSSLSSVDRKAMEVILKHLTSTQRTLKDIHDNSKLILDALKEKDVTRTLRQLRLEWQMVAMTLDRIFFLIFALAIVLSLIMLFPRPYDNIPFEVFGDNNGL